MSQSGFEYIVSFCCVRIGFTVTPHFWNFCLSPELCFQFKREEERDDREEEEKEEKREKREFVEQTFIALA